MTQTEVNFGRFATLWTAIKRTAANTYDDGFIHAGNLAYLSILSIFPFFILGAAIFSLLGEPAERAMTITAVLSALPRAVAEVVSPVAYDVIDARSGWLLWAGVIVAIWTTSSFIETIRDILLRAYDTVSPRSFWINRLISSGVIIGAVLLLLLSLMVQVGIGAAQELIAAYVPELSGRMTQLRLSRLVPALGLFGSLYLIFLTLTPAPYKSRHYRKWPGVLITSSWWLVVTTLLPLALSSVLTYDLTYGSLAGFIVTMIFFWLVGLGLVIGAKFNASLALAADRQPSPDETAKKSLAAIGPHRRTGK
jgi:membrane protein